MGRPLSSKFFNLNANDVVVSHQIQCVAWGPKDSGPTAGVLVGQNSPTRVKAKTVNGTSVCTLSNGTPTASGQVYVKAFPEGTGPTTVATANATLGLVSATPSIGGKGYAVNDYVVVVGGTAAVSGNLQVATVNGSGAILTTTLVNALGTQKYTALPSNIANLSVTTNGNGTGALLSGVFGLDTSFITSSGVGYVSPVMAYPGELVEPVVVAPTVVGGNIAVQQLTISSSGSFTALPVPVIVEETLGTTSNVKIINDAHYLHTFDGTRYRWIHRGMTSWTGGSIPVAYLDTI
jgi:hypothetical protein